ncbi:MAG TPA: serine hydrolase domain-containing protein [bacterium]|nr:serine hydrolase domain-containing protein [bacterium]
MSWWFNLVLFFFLSVPLLAQVLNPHPDYASTVENLRAYLRDQMGRDHVKGLSLALVDGDKIVWSEGFGYADDRAKVPATADTLYRLDFVTKLFTAVEIMRLNAKGRLGLDDPLGADLPGFSIHNRFKRAKPITIRSLLAHHSGLPADYHQGMWAEEPGTLAQLVKDLRDDYLAAPPQAFYKYSDLDYDLLGRIIELKDHKPYAQALRENLLEPLGMVSSTFELDPADQVKLAKGYDKGRETAPLHLRDLPAGGLLSSANDMARFIRFFFTRKPALVPAKALDLMFREQYPGIPLDFGHYQGLGWMLDGLEMENYRDMAWHDGDYGPYFCRVALLRDEKLGVVVMANTMESHEMGRDTALRALKLMREEKYGIPANLVKPKAVMPKLITVPEEKLGKYVGDYAGIGKAAVITRDGAHLRGDLMGHQFDLVPTTGNKFIPRVMILFFPIHLPEYTVDFETVGGRDVIILGGLGAPVVFEKIKPVPIPEAWHQWLGRYRLDDPDGQTKFENMTLEAKGGLLTFNARISSKVFNVTDTDYQINLEPISDEDAIVSGLVSPDGDTVHLYRQDGQVRIYYAGLRFTKVEETTK